MNLLYIHETRGMIWTDFLIKINACDKVNEMNWTRDFNHNAFLNGFQISVCVMGLKNVTFTHDTFLRTKKRVPQYANLSIFHKINFYLLNETKLSWLEGGMRGHFSSILLQEMQVANSHDCSTQNQTLSYTNYNKTTR